MCVLAWWGARIGEGSLTAAGRRRRRRSARPGGKYSRAREGEKLPTTHVYIDKRKKEEGEERNVQYTAELVFSINLCHRCLALFVSLLSSLSLLYI
jgi:hypothetical protein